MELKRDGFLRDVVVTVMTNGSDGILIWHSKRDEEDADDEDDEDGDVQYKNKDKTDSMLIAGQTMPLRKNVRIGIICCFRFMLSVTSSDLRKVSNHFAFSVTFLLS